MVATLPGVEKAAPVYALAAQRLVRQRKLRLEIGVEAFHVLPRGRLRVVRDSLDAYPAHQPLGSSLHVDRQARRSSDRHLARLKVQRVAGKHRGKQQHQSGYGD